LKNNHLTLEGLASGKIKRIVVSKVKIGVDLLEAIEEIVKIEKIRRGIIIGGVGALQKAVFRNMFEFPKEYPIRPKHRLYLEVKKPMELVSLTGYIVPKDDTNEIYIHPHFSASMVEGKTVVTMGGHLDKGTITHVRVAVIIGELENIDINASINRILKSHDLKINSGNLK